MKAVDFFTESFTSTCPFVAVECSSYNDFLTGRCQCNDGSNNCFYMGYKADRLLVSNTLNDTKYNSTDLDIIRRRPEETRAYLITSATRPFCRTVYPFIHS